MTFTMFVPPPPGLLCSTKYRLMLSCGPRHDGPRQRGHAGAGDAGERVADARGRCDSRGYLRGR
jgi:hypothetical protein